MKTSKLFFEGEGKVVTKAFLKKTGGKGIGFLRDNRVFEGGEEGDAGQNRCFVPSGDQLETDLRGVWGQAPPGTIEG